MLRARAPAVVVVAAGPANSTGTGAVSVPGPIVAASGTSTGSTFTVDYTVVGGITRTLLRLRRTDTQAIVATVRRSVSGSDSYTFTGLTAGVTYEALLSPLASATGSITADGGAAETIATVTFDGSGDDADTVAIFGHAFPEGALPEDAPLLARRADNDAELRTQHQVLTTWPDGSAKTISAAVELPALTSTTLLPVELVANDTHSSPGSALTWSGALSGRSIAIKTWTPGNNTTPLWTYDVAAALTSSSDDWMTGPLAICRRVRTAVPSSAVLNTSNTAGVREGVWLVADVTATKDGMILVDASFCNDYVNTANTGTARFGFTIEIDGTIVYDQRPSAASYNTDLLRYSRWVRRRGKKGAKVYDFHSTFRPLFRPDFAKLVEARATHNFDTAVQPSPSNTVAARHSAGSSNLAVYTESWGLTPDQGAAGGRIEIGWHSLDAVLWMAWPSSARLAEILCHHQAEYFFTSRRCFYDHGTDKPCLVDEYVQLVTWHERFMAGPAASPNLVTGLITPPDRLFDPAGVLLSDDEHRGELYAMPALLSARRCLYDGIAIRAAEATLVTRWEGWKDTQTLAQCRYGINSGCNQWDEDGAATVPKWETGSQWRGAIWSPSTRATGWAFRDVAYADYVLPDAYPRRDFYTKNLAAWFNAFHHHRNNIESLMFAGVGLPSVHTNSGNHVTWMYHFLGFALAFCMRAGIGGTNAAAVTENYLRFRALALEDDNYLRRLMNGKDTPLGSGGNFPLASSKAALFALPTVVPADWSSDVGEGDYQHNAQSVMAALASPDSESTLQAKAFARELLVRLRSERRQASGAPRTRATDFADAGQPQMNLITAPGWTWVLDAAPVITAGQSFSASTAVAAGTIIGCVEWTGATPRCSTASNANNDAFEITSQPAGNPFTISKGGVIRRNSGGTFPSGATVIQVRARTYNDSNTLLQGSAVDVTINGT